MKMKLPKGKAANHTSARKLSTGKSGILKPSVRYLVALTSMLMFSQAATADVQGKQIGDLEIYKSAEEGKTTVMLMLDTSGSMSSFLYNKYYSATACDLPSNINGNNTRPMQMSSGTVPAYTRNGCQNLTQSANIRYRYYRQITNNGVNWYACDNPANTSSCDVFLNNAPNVSGLLYRPNTNSSNPNGNGYFYSASDGYHFDRLTRLKQALFYLMESNDIDTSVQLGIGQYSSQSNENNTSIASDGLSGKILVPAAPLDNAQRAKIKQAVAALKGENGTPTAHAYAEVGAYMLGTNTDAYIKNYVIEDQEQYILWNSQNNLYRQCNNTIYDICYGLGGFVTLSNAQINSYNQKACKAYASGGSPMTCLTKDKVESNSTKPINGFGKSHTSSKKDNKYISPISGSPKCNGYGIYYLTDGVPNSSPKALEFMKSALGSKGSSFSLSGTTLPNGSADNNAMREVGKFAKALRDPSKNPKANSILTAVVGFGSVFDVDASVIKRLPQQDDKGNVMVDGQGNTLYRDYYDCEKISDIDARNACNWGEKNHSSLPGVGGYGNGGFYSAKKPQDIVDSLLAFIGDPVFEIPASPAGTISIADNPYSAGTTSMARAYLPMLLPEVAKNPIIWPGNLKSYQINDAALFGKSNKALFNAGWNTSPTTQDMWSPANFLDKSNNPANNTVNAGGVFANLKAPSKTNLANTRSVWVEDRVGGNDVLRKISVAASGKVLLDGVPMSTSNTFGNTGLYTEAVQRLLLKYLGFVDLPSGAVKAMTLTAANVDNQATKVLGGIMHSKPTTVSYKATLDDGRVTETETDRDDYVLFGSMDGALHLVDAIGANAGEEAYAIIPKAMLESQATALDPNALGAIGIPKFGIDAPWLIDAKYKYNSTSVDATTINAVGGMRMGGNGIYSFDLSSKSTPKMNFRITSASTGFNRMGKIWSKPVKATIKTSATDKGTDVFVLGAGYDDCYENTEFQVGVTNTALGSCSGKTAAIGNDLYIINAKTGALIWKASTLNPTDMKHSIVAEVTTLDRNNDGFMDHIYFADLGGQVFRADFKNAGDRDDNAPADKTKNYTAFTAKNVTRVLKDEHAGTKYARRFYERPTVSIYRHPNNNKLFALVNVISGDRSSPLSKMRQTSQYANRMYGIFDIDISSQTGDLRQSEVFMSGFTPRVKDLDASKNLLNLSSALGNEPTTAKKTQVRNQLINELYDSSKDLYGWYYPMIYFDGYKDVKYSKGVGASAVISGFLYTTVYNPDKQYDSPDSCDATILGGSERQLYCLPYGICMSSYSKNGRGGFLPAGKGIQELTLGPRDKDNLSTKVLISGQTLTEQWNASNLVDFGGDTDKDMSLPTKQGNKNLTQDGSDGNMAGYIFNERFTLKPTTWYEETQTP